MPKSATLDKMYDLFPALKCNPVFNTFELIMFAESCIAKAVARNPERKPYFDSVFLHLRPHAVIASKRKELQMAHISELVRRVARGESIAGATDAELLCMLSDTSRHAPLVREAVLLMQFLMRRTMPTLYNTELKDKAIESSASDMEKVDEDYKALKRQYKESPYEKRPIKLLPKKT